MPENNDLRQWEIDFRKRIFQELDNLELDLTPENIPAIVEAFSYEKRKQRNKDIPKGQPGWCPYYASKTSCHPQVYDLNCFLCSCPNYDSSFDNGKCTARSTLGKYIPAPGRKDNVVWDCSGCLRYHSPKEVTLWLSKNIGKLAEEKSRLTKIAPQEK